jgi:hypothetical protein
VIIVALEIPNKISNIKIPSGPEIEYVEKERKNRFYGRRDSDNYQDNTSFGPKILFLVLALTLVPFLILWFFCPRLVEKEIQIMKLYLPFQSKKFVERLQVIYDSIEEKNKVIETFFLKRFEEIDQHIVLSIENAEKLMRDIERDDFLSRIRENNLNFEECTLVPYQVMLKSYEDTCLSLTDIRNEMNNFKNLGQVPKRWSIDFYKSVEICQYKTKENLSFSSINSERNALIKKFIITKEDINLQNDKNFLDLCKDFDNMRKNLGILREIFNTKIKLKDFVDQAREIHILKYQSLKRYFSFGYRFYVEKSAVLVDIRKTIDILDTTLYHHNCSQKNIEMAKKCTSMTKDILARKIRENKGAILSDDVLKKLTKNISILKDFTNLIDNCTSIDDKYKSAILKVDTRIKKMKEHLNSFSISNKKAKVSYLKDKKDMPRSILEVLKKDIRDDGLIALEFLNGKTADLESLNTRLLSRIFLKKNVKDLREFLKTVRINTAADISQTIQKFTAITY